jgi:hypothetical protein
MYVTREVFTPTRPARIAFVERDEVNDKLVNALSTPGKQIVVYGHSGTGKTTLLINKLHQLYENHITTRCMKGLKFDQLILDAFDQIAPFYTSEISKSTKSQASFELSAAYKILSAKVAQSHEHEAGEKRVRILPPQLTPQALGKFLGGVKACWVLEDFHKIDAEEKQKLSQLMKVFMDMSDDYPELKIVALGAVDTARQVIEYDPEMRNRVAEINVTLMTEQEIISIIMKGESALNVRFNPQIKKTVAKHSNGLASVCHHLCLNMCDAAGVLTTVEGPPYHLTTKNCEAAVKTYVDEASDSIKSAFGKALKPRRNNQFNNAEIILRTLSKFSESGSARFDLLRRIQKEIPGYLDRTIKVYLGKLCTIEYGAILRFDSSSGLYSFSDPIYRSYALALYQERPKDPVGTQAETLAKSFEETLLVLLRDRVKVQIERVNMSIKKT